MSDDGQLQSHDPTIVYLTGSAIAWLDCASSNAITAHMKASILCKVPVNECCNLVMSLFVVNLNKEGATTKKVVSCFIMVVIQMTTGKN